MLLVLCCEPVFCTLCRPIPNYSDGGILLSCCMGDMHVVGLDESGMSIGMSTPPIEDTLSTWSLCHHNGDH